MIPPANLTASAVIPEPLADPADLIRWCVGVGSELNQCAVRHAALSVGHGQMSLGYSYRGFAERQLRHEQKEAFRATDSVVFKTIGGVMLGGICTSLFLAVAGMEAQGL